MAKFAVIGLGSFGATVAKQLAFFNHEVLGIDTNKKIVEDLAPDLAYTVVADASDENVLRELNLQDYDTTIVTIGENIEASILSLLHLKTLGVKHIWGVAKTEAHHMILTYLGITKIIHPEQDMGMRIANALNYPIVSRYMVLGDGHFMVKIKITENILDKLQLQSIHKLIQQEAGIHFVLLKRQGRMMIQIPEDMTLQLDDIIILAGAENELKKLYSRYGK